MKRVLLTGSSGFLGQEILKSLKTHAWSVTTLGRRPGHDILCDLSHMIPSVSGHFETVIHCAGLAHFIPRTIADENEFKQSHLQGMKNLLAGLETQRPGRFVFISTVSVYGLESGRDISETTPCHPTTPYGQYKLEAEQALTDWCRQHQIPFWIIRPPLIIGDNPPGNLNSLIRAIQKNIYVFIGGVNPRRCLVLGRDLADFLAESVTRMTLYNSGVYNVTDGKHPTLNEVVHFLVKRYNPNFKKITVPRRFIALVARIGDFIPGFPLNSLRLKKLSTELLFDDQKARQNIQWNGKDALRD